jgi:hypothetical protein
MDHGQWMTEVAKLSTADVIGFIEPDCIPLSREKLTECFQYVIDNNTFCGIAQASNHIEPKNHIYAAPGFFAITKSAYHNLGSPSFMCTMRGDTGEEVSTKEVKAILVELIDSEDKQKPLSDDELTDLLQEKGYNIARRTVAKYRELLNIPVARLRKEL